MLANTTAQASQQRYNWIHHVPFSSHSSVTAIAHGSEADSRSTENDICHLISDITPPSLLGRCVEPTPNMETSVESRFIAGNGLGGSGLSDTEDSDSLSPSSSTRASHTGSGVSPLPPSYFDSSTQSRHAPSEQPLETAPEIVVWTEDTDVGRERHPESEEPTPMDTSSE